jgi:hypothetical protein
MLSSIAQVYWSIPFNSITPPHTSSTMTTQPPSSLPIPISNHNKSPSESSQSSTLSPVTPFSMPTPRNFATSPSQAAGLFRWGGFPSSLSKSPNAPISSLPVGSPPRAAGAEDEVGAMAQRHDRSVSIAGPGTGVMGDKQARGHGVLRRLSLGGGAGFARVSSKGSSASRLIRRRSAEW